ncbi:MAG: VWA domain-containing protein [Oscillospiraceae bacterium]|nr:VWA domain-containing protein [Oscillospiraceae bacterium]
MKNNITELVFILDRSGSMAGLVSDTIGGFNSMIARQKQEQGEVYVTTVLFDTRFDRIHDRLPLEEVPVLTEKDYVPGGCTALLDAIGDTVRHIAHIHRYSRPEDVPEKTVVVITTDGLENASRRCSLGEVKKLIEHEQEKYGWEFLFLGANIDAVETAGSMGIRADRSANFMPDGAGVGLSFHAVSEAICSVQRGESLPCGWNAEVEQDHRRRRRK